MSLIMVIFSSIVININNNNNVKNHRNDNQRVLDPGHVGQCC